MTPSKDKSWRLQTRMVGLTVGTTALATGIVSPAQAEHLEFSPTGSVVAETSRLQQLQEGAKRAQAERFEQQPIDLIESQPAVLDSNVHADGVYLYGERPAAHQTSTTYFVFEAQSGSVTGAFYMPSSSFDCVQGQISAAEMALQVTDSYLPETSAYTLALNAPTAEVASRINVPAPPNIEGFYSLPVSQSDRAILATCQANLQ